MPWFRFLKRSADAAEQSSTAEAAGPAEQPAAADIRTEAPSPATGADSAQRRRRSGSRGGRNRRKRTGAGAAAASKPDEAESDKREADKPEAAAKARRPRGEQKDADKASSSRKRSTRGSSSGGRRKQAPRRAPLPAAKRELVISVDAGEQRVAILEDDRVAEVYLERPDKRSIAGNIYVGVVDNVLPGMEAAFVEIGLEKNGFLYVDEIVAPELEGKAREGKRITDLIQRGQQILVQAVKDPMKTKGARLTTEISLPGRFLVYVPYGEGLGVSRRLEDAERTRLKEILRDIEPKQGGVIVRTAAEGASAEDIERDLVFLERLWKNIQARSKTATAPELVYQEAELPLRIVRDLFAGDFVAAHVDDDRAYRRIVGYLKKTSPHMLERVHRDKEKEPLFERYGIEREIASTLERRVDLPSGGYLIFDYAEAFTVVDVNTGRFVGSRKKNSTQRLEDTIVKNNLEAVKEVVRQLRLRDIGGIIVIDFIDMANPKNRQSVEDALRAELERDRTKTYVVEISPLGLVEMTRQNVTEGPREVMTRKCHTCGGDGIVVADATIAIGIERRLRALASAGARGVQAYRVALHPHTLSLVAGPGGDLLQELERSTRRRFFLVPAEGHVHADHFDVLAEGKLVDMQPQQGVAEDAEIQVKLVEVGLHDAAAGVGKVDGVDVVVAGAAPLVGKTVPVRVARVLDGTALATLVDAGAAPVPITFESEAEKPTRAPARRVPAKTPQAPEDDAASRTADEAETTAETPEPEAASEPEGEASGAAKPKQATKKPPRKREPKKAVADESEDAETEPEGALAEAEADEDEKPKKKKTRRGSRGGRRRKKKPAIVETAEEVSGDGEGQAAPGGDGEQAAAGGEAPAKSPARRIHVPDAGLGRETGQGAGSAVEEPAASDGDQGEADAETPKRKTRRGSRGGRNRRRKAATAVAAADNGDAVSSGDEPAAAVAPARDEYVPMSEWEDAFES